MGSETRGGHAAGDAGWEAGGAGGDVSRRAGIDPLQPVALSKSAAGVQRKRQVSVSVMKVRSLERLSLANDC
jgi:hypothetical protein